jgi:hypothetical protein
MKDDEGVAMGPAEYFKLRLEHTIQHTQQSTRLIYIVNGAVLGMIYFVIQASDFPARKGVIVLALSTLVMINFLHVLLIFRQGHWYHAIDKELASTVKASPVRLGDGSDRIIFMRRFASFLA